MDVVRVFLFQVEPLDPLSLAGAATLLLALILAGSRKLTRAGMRVGVARILAEE
jgi:hypothetical protein